MLPVPTVFDVPEQTSGCYLARITDVTGVTLIPASALSSLLLTLYTVDALGVTGVVNGRTHQNVLNVNDVEVFETVQTDPAGHTFNLRWTYTPADTTLANPALKVEKHIALWEWTWAAGTRAGKHEVILAVKNLREVG